MVEIDVHDRFVAVPFSRRDHGAFKALRDIVGSGEKVFYLDINAIVRVDILNPRWEFGGPQAAICAITNKRLVAFGSDWLPSGLVGHKEPRGYRVLDVLKGDISSMKAVHVPEPDFMNIEIVARGQTHSIDWFILQQEKPVMRLLQGFM
ncbi:hypothetical protein [Sphingobium yanoikuyae]|uniref:hypothetical protein n=1 Tax=Sphingobium yanoikuyae TaxID=13690 RepID=UPI00241EC0BA|nr:hypothetical protein [Sphingobium yanoikuyae]